VIRLFYFLPILSLAYLSYRDLKTGGFTLLEALLVSYLSFILSIIIFGFNTTILYVFSSFLITYFLFHFDSSQIFAEGDYFVLGLILFIFLPDLFSILVFLLFLMLLLSSYGTYLLVGNKETQGKRIIVFFFLAYALTILSPF